MLPRRFTAEDPESVRARYKIVRRDDFSTIAGLILSADIDTGVAVLRGDKGAVEEYSLSPDGFRIVTAAR
jgi:hypothetical protein